MEQKVRINRENATLEEILVAQNCAPKKEGFKRYQAIDFLYCGQSKKAVAQALHVSIRTIERWLKLFNEKGIDGLAKKGRSGRPRKIPLDKFKAEYVPLVLEPERVGEDNFTAIKFHGFLKEEYKETLSYSTLLKYFRESNLSLVKGRPCVCEKQDEEKRAKFIKEFKKVAATKTEIFFCDEVGFEGDPRPRSTWVMKGSKPVAGRSSDHLRLSAIGSANPGTGEFISFVFTEVDREIFQVYLDHLAEKTEGRDITLVLDNASWHKSKTLNWHHIKPLFLPPYSPDFNPIENIWNLLKGRFFTNWYAKNIEQLLERVCLALNDLSKDPEQLSKTTAFDHLLR